MQKQKVKLSLEAGWLLGWRLVAPGFSPAFWSAGLKSRCRPKGQPRSFYILQPPGERIKKCINPDPFGTGRAGPRLIEQLLHVTG